MVWIWHHSVSLPVEIPQKKQYVMTDCVLDAPHYRNPRPYGSSMLSQRELNTMVHHQKVSKRKENGYIKPQSSLNQWLWDQVTTLESEAMSCVKYLKRKIFLLPSVIFLKTEEMKNVTSWLLLLFLSHLSPFPHLPQLSTCSVSC